MNILVIGGTGQVGSLILQELAEKGASARVLTTNPAKADLPESMIPVKGDLLNPASLRTALDGVETMFLLNSVSPSEATQALIALDLAHEAGVAHVVYLSQVKLDWPDCPHAAAKASAEALIRYHNIPATILRPAYFFQNDVWLKEQILGGTYPIPIGGIGAEMVDVRDIAAIAALAILNRQAIGPDPVIELVGPDLITCENLAEIWSDVTGRPVAYGGDDLGVFEEQRLQNMPPWQAHDLVATFRNCQREGMRGKPGAAERLAMLLGRPMRSYRAFAKETYKQWKDQ